MKLSVLFGVFLLIAIASGVPVAAPEPEPSAPAVESANPSEPDVLEAEAEPADDLKTDNTFGLGFYVHKPYYGGWGRSYYRPYYGGWGGYGGYGGYGGWGGYGHGWNNYYHGGYWR